MNTKIRNLVVTVGLAFAVVMGLLFLITVMWGFIGLITSGFTEFLLKLLAALGVMLSVGFGVAGGMEANANDEDVLADLKDFITDGS